MRMVSITCPQGQGKYVLEAAFAAGMAEASIQQILVHKAGKPPVLHDKVETETTTPVARKFVETLLAAPFYEQSAYVIVVRDVRVLAAGRDPAAETWPVTICALEVFQGLWQFSHVTASHVCRAFIAALLLAYGMIEMNVPVMIAGLIFLPYNYQMLSIGFGLMTQDGKLLRQGAWNLLLTSILVLLAGTAVALFKEPPLLFDEFGTLTTSFLFALVIGIAAVLASADDAGRRELVGLAAASQVSLIPAWIGISLVFGFPESGIVLERVGSLAVSIATLSLSSAGTFAALRFRKRIPRRQV